jgi:aerobic-type carbon monoxide dehydrogenase small subunit (CoxS/CutS family)
VDPDVPLVGLLRDDLGLTGTKLVCAGGMSGACVAATNWLYPVDRPRRWS